MSFLSIKVLLLLLILVVANRIELLDLIFILFFRFFVSLFDCLLTVIEIKLLFQKIFARFSLLLIIVFSKISQIGFEFQIILNFTIDFIQRCLTQGFLNLIVKLLIEWPDFLKNCFNLLKSHHKLGINLFSAKFGRSVETNELIILQK